jgi:hypothetical protein
VVNDRGSALAALRSFLAAARADIEARVADDGDETRTFADLSAVPRLSAALDRYDSAVRGIKYPHLRDPLLISVRTQMELLQATGVSQHRVPQSAAERLKATLNSL